MNESIDDLADRLAEVEAERDALREMVEGRFDVWNENGEPVLPRGWVPVDGGRLDELEAAAARLAEVEQALRFFILNVDSLADSMNTTVFDYPIHAARAVLDKGEPQ